MNFQSEELDVNEQSDDAQNYALMVVAGVVAMVIAGVIALAAATTMNAGDGQAADKDGSAVAAPMAEADGRIFFEVGSDALPPEAAEVLKRVKSHPPVAAATATFGRRDGGCSWSWTAERRTRKISRSAIIAGTTTQPWPVRPFCVTAGATLWGAPARSHRK